MVEAQPAGGGVTIDEVRRDFLASNVQHLLPALRRDQNLVVVEVAECSLVSNDFAIVVATVNDGRSIMVPAVRDGGSWRRAAPGDGVAVAVFEAPPPLEVSHIAALPALNRRAERGITADMSNDIVVVDEQIAVKWQFVVAEGSMAGPRLVAHLASVGFTEMPEPIATVSWNERLVASAARYLPGAVDGWEWMVNDLTVHVREGAPAPVWPRDLGSLVGRMHRACSTPSEVITQPVGSAGDLGGLVAHYQTLMSRIPSLDEELRAALDPWLDRMRDAVDTLETARDVAVIPLHGDLHAGQFLRWRDGVAVSDFDGNPLLPMEQRGDQGPAAFDLASLVRSLDHVAQVAARRCREASDDSAAERALAWASSARTEVLDGYLATGDAAVLDERLLHAFESLSPLHEAVYATDYLPRWRYVPLGVLARGW